MSDQCGRAASPMKPNSYTETRVHLAEQMGYIRRADGLLDADWHTLRTSLAEARIVLRQHLSCADFPMALTRAAHAASEALRPGATVPEGWQAAQLHGLLVLAVAQSVLRVLVLVAQPNRHGQ